jgi:hypothetical protein
VNLGALVEFGQREVGRSIANRKRSGSCLLPHRFKGKNQKRYRSGNFGHETAKALRRLLHGVVDRYAAAHPQNGEDTECGHYDLFHGFVFSIHAISNRTQKKSADYRSVERKINNKKIVVSRQDKQSLLG